MNSPKPQFKNAFAKEPPNFDAISAAIDQVAIKNDIGSMIKPSEAQATTPTTTVVTLPKKERGPRKPQRAEERKLTVMVPLYLLEAIEKKRTLTTTKRYVVLSAFKAAGYEVREVDFMEDGRRGRDL